MKAEKYQRSKRGGIYNMFKPKTMKKINKEEKARMDQDLERQKKMWIARGKIKVLDELWIETDWQTREKIINGVSKDSKWSDDKEWEGLTLTEKIAIIKYIISKENV